jgi:hypothetical protein
LEGRSMMQTAAAFLVFWGVALGMSAGIVFVLAL